MAKPGAYSIYVEDLDNFRQRSMWEKGLTAAQVEELTGPKASKVR